MSGEELSDDGLPQTGKRQELLLRWKARLNAVAAWADRRTGGAVSVLRGAYGRFNQVHGPEAAASIAFYAIFSLFPLLLVLVSVLGYMLISSDTTSQLIAIISRIFPLARTVIEENFAQILQQRQAGGLVGTVGLIWSASGVFITLTRAVNRAWPQAHGLTFFQSRLTAVVMILILTVLTVLLFSSIALFNLFPHFNIPLDGSLAVYNTLLWALVSNLVPWALAFGVCLAIYRWLPNIHVGWKEAFWGALAATLAWGATTQLFTWFLSSGLSNYELVYGSLGTTVALLTWIYLSAVILLFGAHISAAVGEHRRLKKASSQ